MRHLDRAPPSAMLILACALWGAATVLNKALLASLPSLTLLVLQLTASVAALWAVTLVSRVKLPPPRLVWPIAALGLLNPGVVSGSADPLAIVSIQQSVGLVWATVSLAAGTRFGAASDIAALPASHWRRPLCQA